MSEKKQLQDEELQKVAGGSGGAVPKLEYDTACSSFVCTECGRGHSQHKIETNSQLTKWVYTFDGTNWIQEWRDHQLDCNHCKYFHHINWATGECTKDCQ